MDFVLFAIITLLLVILAIVITIFVLRQRYQARLIESSNNQKLLEDTSRKSRDLEAELRALLPYQTLAQKREKSLESAKSEVSRIQAELTGAMAEIRGLKTQLDQQQLILEGTFKKMEGEFQILSQKMLEDSSLKLGEKSKESLKAVLEPLSRDMGDFKKRIDDTHIEDTKQRASLQEQVRMLS
jgi:DNA recombination protein RmuC